MNSKRRHVLVLLEFTIHRVREGNATGFQQHQGRPNGPCLHLFSVPSVPCGSIRKSPKLHNKSDIAAFLAIPIPLFSRPKPNKHRASLYP